MSLEAVVKKIRQQKFWRDKMVMIPLGIGLLINIINWPFLYFQMRHSGQLVPLRYNILNGVGAIGPWTKLFLLPLYGAIVLIINAFMVYRAYQRENTFIIRLLLISQMIIQVLFLIALILITRL